MNKMNKMNKTINKEESMNKRRYQIELYGRGPTLKIYRIAPKGYKIYRHRWLHARMWDSNGNGCIYPISGTPVAPVHGFE